MERLSVMSETKERSMGTKLKVLFVAVFAAITATASIPIVSAEELPLLHPQCGATVTQSFRMGSDRTCTGHGLVVGKAGITIDLNGHTLKGDGDIVDFGIAIYPDLVGVPVADVTVRNGTLRHFGLGVYSASNARGTAVSLVTAVDNVQSGFGFFGDQARLVDSVATANGLGVQATSRGYVIKRNTFAANEAYGGVFGSDALVNGNRFLGNGDMGVNLFGRRAELVSNVIEGNGHDGLFKHGVRLDSASQNNVVSNNRIIGNAADGYHDEGTSNKVTRNIAHGNGYEDGDSDNSGRGFDTAEATTPKGSGNRALGNDAPLQCLPIKRCNTVRSSNTDLPLYTPQCNELVKKSFRLAADMTCAGAAIRAGKQGITIDLNGKTIRGDGEDPDSAVVVHTGEIEGGSGGVTVTNGVIRGFGSAVTWSQVPGVISKVISVDNQWGLFFTGPGLTVKKNVLVGNSLYGLLANGEDTTTIVRNHAVNNQEGIRLATHTGGAVKKNFVVANTLAGLRSSGDGTTVAGNTVAGNGIAAGGAGVELFDTSSLNVTTKNLIVGNGGDGYRDVGAANSVTFNTAIGNGYVDHIGDAQGAGINSVGLFSYEQGNVASGNDGAQCIPSEACI